MNDRHRSGPAVRAGVWAWIPPPEGVPAAPLSGAIPHWIGGYPPEADLRWAEIDRPGPPQLALADRLPQDATWMAVRDANAEIERLLVFRRSGLRNHHLDHASFFFFNDEFLVLSSQARRVLLGFADGRVYTRSNGEEKEMPGGGGLRKWFAPRRRAKRLLQAAVIGSVTVPEVGIVTLVEPVAAFRVLTGGFRNARTEE